MDADAAALRRDALEEYLGQVLPVTFDPTLLVLSYLISLVGAASTLELIHRRTSRRGYYNKQVCSPIPRSCTRTRTRTRIRICLPCVDPGSTRSDRHTRRWLTMWQPPPARRLNHDGRCSNLEHGTTRLPPVIFSFRVSHCR